jgi:hypothetical protein
MQDLSTAVISQWRKEAMRSTLKTFKKTIIDADKAAKAKLVQKVSCRHAPTVAVKQPVQSKVEPVYSSVCVR